MKATRLRGQDTGDVRLHLGKGILLILTPAEYVRGLNKGKAERRAARHARELERQLARVEAQCLDWLKEGEDV